MNVNEFWPNVTPVTNVQLAQFLQETGYRTPAETRGWSTVWREHAWQDVQQVDWRHPQGPETGLVGLEAYPVVHASWLDAVAYTQWAGKRLPTETEWEKGARGTDGREYPSGDELPAESLCNFGRNQCGTTPAGSYSPRGDSPYGTADMAGNVWAWTTSKDRRGNRILRGGSWYNSPRFVRCACRFRFDPDQTYANVGFRCARDAE